MPFDPTMPMRDPASNSKLKSSMIFRSPKESEMFLSSTVLFPSRGGAGISSSMSESRIGPERAAISSNRFIRPRLRLSRALGERRTHSISERRKLRRFSSAMSSRVSRSALAARKSA